jgi:hypothetical protein
MTEALTIYLARCLVWRSERELRNVVLVAGGVSPQHGEAQHHDWRWEVVLNLAEAELTQCPLIGLAKTLPQGFPIHPKSFFYDLMQLRDPETALLTQQVLGLPRCGDDSEDDNVELDVTHETKEISQLHHHQKSR